MLLSLNLKINIMVNFPGISNWFENYHEIPFEVYKHALTEGRQIMYLNCKKQNE
jgi:hypothetical protein